MILRLNVLSQIEALTLVAIVPSEAKPFTVSIEPEIEADWVTSIAQVSFTSPAMTKRLPDAFELLLELYVCTPLR